MRTNKEMVVMYMQDMTIKKGEDFKGFTTQELSADLNIQRTNLSAILNDCVKQGILEKSKQRPVLYRLKEGKKEEKHLSCFSKLIGVNGSLKNAVQLAKAAILYPEDAMSTLIVGEQGTGKTFFSNQMYEFAKEKNIIRKEAPLVTVNCNQFIDNEEDFFSSLFSDSGGYIYQVKGGVLLIERIDLMSSKVLTAFFEQLNTLLCRDYILICTMVRSVKEVLNDTYINTFPIRIELPDLRQRPLSERLEFVEKFFMDEAEKVKKEIQIDSELLRCFLLYFCQRNVLQLQNDIKIGCANAYVRDINQNADVLRVYIHDCPSYIRKGFLFYKENREKIKALIPDNYRYTYTKNRSKKYEETILKVDQTSIYDTIEKKVEELRKRNIKEDDIMTIISSGIENDVSTIKNYIETSKIDRNVLTKLVDNRIIDLVDTFFKGASTCFNKVYSISTFYAMCLYLTTCIKKKGYTQHLSNDKIIEVVEKYKDEYAYSMSFASRLEEAYGIQITMDEVIFITFFLCENEIQNKEKHKPSLLVVMHGNIASAIADTVNQIYKEQIVYSYDLSLEKEMKQAYEELKNLCKMIDNGTGIMIIYDMGSVKVMIDSIIHETGIRIRKLEIPITLITLNCALKLSTSNNLDITYDDILTNGFDIGMWEKETNVKEKHKAIITLCMTGKGSAVQIKQYLEKNLDTSDIFILALATSNRNLLINEISKIKEDHEILCVVGTYDPRLFDIPYISITKLFDTPVDKLPMILALEDLEEKDSVDFDAMYEYLQEQLEHIDITILKKTVPGIIKNIKKIVPDFTINEEVGLFMHVACSINRIKSGEGFLKNIHKEGILLHNKKLYHSLKDILAELEAAMSFTFNDDELATIIEIIK